MVLSARKMGVLRPARYRNTDQLYSSLIVHCAPLVYREVQGVAKEWGDYWRADVPDDV